MIGIQRGSELCGRSYRRSLASLRYTAFGHITEHLRFAITQPSCSATLRHFANPSPVKQNIASLQFALNERRLKSNVKFEFV